MKRVELDNTSRVCFDACEQKYYLRHILNLVPLEPSSMAPYFGAAIHKGVQAFYEGKLRDESIKEFAIEYAEHFDEKDDERTPANRMIVLDEYFKRFKDDYLKTIKLEIGHSIVIEVDGLEIVYHMRIDRIAQWDKEVALEDWKTSKYVGSSFTIIRPNNQFTGYSLGVRELMGVNPTFFLTIIGTKVRKRVTEGQERVDIVRENIKYSDEEFEEFKRGVVVTAKRICECKESKYWAKRSHSCPSFSGCEYLPLCRASRETFESMRSTFYKVSEWKAFETNSEGGE